MKLDPLTVEAKGQRTLIETLFRRAEVEPQKHYGSFALTDDLDDGFRHFTFAEMAKAVDACAWHINETYGTSNIFEPILYMGVNDYRYHIIFFAAIKCGFKALLINPRYPLEGILAVIEKTGCYKAFHSPEELPIIKDIQNNREGFQAFELAAQACWLSAEPRPYNFIKTWEDSKDDPVLVLHSSGTTGLPKPFGLTNRYFAALDKPWPLEAGRQSTNPIEIFAGGRLHYSKFVQCHIGGLIFTNVVCVFAGVATIMEPTTTDHTIVLRMLQEQPIDLVSATPFLLESMAQLEDGCEVLSKLQWIIYGGGPLRKDLNREFALQNVPLINLFGSTEMGFVPGLVLPAEDSEWIEFNPAYQITFEPVGDEVDTSELILRKESGPEDEKLHHMRAVYWSLGVDEHRTKDLFIPHPTRPNLWRYSGRKDDILVLAHAGKFNPIPVEDAICCHPRITGALVTGEYRQSPCALIEPKEKVMDQGQFIQEVWPQVEKANKQIRGDMRIPKEFVAVLEESGLERGIKGQVIRKINNKKHVDIIDGLYGE